MLSGAVIIERGRFQSRLRESLRRGLVVRRMRAALQRRFVQAYFIQDRSDGCNVERLAGMRGRHYRDFARLQLESFAHAGRNRRGRNERFCRRTKEDRRFDIAGLLENRSVGIDRAGRDAVNRLDVSRAGYVDIDFIGRDQTSAGSTIVASCSAKTGLLK